MTQKEQDDVRNYYASKGIIVPNNYKFPQCNHPIEKWCSNCDYDEETYERIPHFKKYSFIKKYTEEELRKELNEK